MMLTKLKKNSWEKKKLRIKDPRDMASIWENNLVIVLSMQ